MWTKKFKRNDFELQQAKLDVNLNIIKKDKMDNDLINNEYIDVNNVNTIDKIDNSNVNVNPKSYKSMLSTFTSYQNEHLAANHLKNVNKDRLEIGYELFNKKFNNLINNTE